MRKNIIIAASAALLLAMPVASAATSISIVDESVVVEPGTSYTLDFNVTVDCLDILASVPVPSLAYSAAVTVTAPDFLGGDTSTSVAFPLLDCPETVPTLAVTKTGSVTFTVAEDAVGMAAETVSLSSGTGGDSIDVAANYTPGYTFTVDATFPMEIGSDSVSFNATLHLFSNADTMAMWAPIKGAEFVSITGLPDFITYQDGVLDGGEEVMQEVSIKVTPPSGTWTNDTYSFRTWSHWLGNGDMKSDDMVYEWTFVNTGGGDDSKGSPGFAPLLMVAALAAAAVIARRR